MTTLKLKSLTLEAFGPFQKKQTVTFPEKGLVLIRGVNKDTDGSSGSGKTRLLEAIAYSFDCAALPATELQSWHTDKPLSVTAKFQAGKIDCERKLGKQSYLELMGTEKVTSAAAIKARMRELTGLSPEMLQVLTYRPQHQPGMFLTMTDSQKKEFLSSLLGLGTYEALAEQARKDQTKLTNDVNGYRLMVEQCERGMENNPMPAHQSALDTSELEQKVEALRIAKDEAEKRTIAPVNGMSDSFKKDREQLQAKLRVANVEMDVLADKHKTEVLGKQSVIDELTRQLTGCITVTSKRQHWADKKDSIEKKLESIKASTCPTCHQPWKADDAHMDKLFDEYKNTINAINDVNAKAIKQAELVEAIDRAKENLKTLVKSSPIDPQLIKTADELKAAIAKAQAEEQAYVNEVRAKLRQKYTEAAAEFNMAHQKLLHDQQMNESKQKEYDAALHRHKVSKSQYEAAKATLEGTTTELNTVTDTLALLRGFLAIIFNEVLDEISKHTNEILRSVPNTQHLTLRFDSERTSDAGTVRREIRPVLFASGRQLPSIKGLSGGQRTAIELATDIALGRVIARRTGSFPGWLILDESFDGLDTISKR